METEEFFRLQDQVQAATSTIDVQAMLTRFEGVARQNPDEPWIHYLVGYTRAELGFRNAEAGAEPVTSGHP